MPANAKEKRANREAFRKMNRREKIDYIFTYYKLPIFTVLIAATVLIHSAVRIITRKETVLCMAFTNVAVGEDLMAEMTDSYLLETERDLKKNEIIVYGDLYLSSDPAPENHQFAYASKLKVLAAINARQLDLVLMNREAYDLMSSSGFLLELDDVLAMYPGLNENVSPYVCENAVILEDNAVEFSLGEAEEYESVTEDERNAIACSSFSAFRNAGFDNEVYIGIIANSTKIEESIAWLTFFSEAGN